MPVALCLGSVLFVEGLVKPMADTSDLVGSFSTLLLNFKANSSSGGMQFVVNCIAVVT